MNCYCTGSEARVIEVYSVGTSYAMCVCTADVELWIRGANLQPYKMSSLVICEFLDFPSIYKEYKVMLKTHQTLAMKLLVLNSCFRWYLFTYIGTRIQNPAVKPINALVKKHVVDKVVHSYSDSVMKSSIAQLVERTAVNRKVASSNLAGGEHFFDHFFIPTVFWHDILDRVFRLDYLLLNEVFFKIFVMKSFPVIVYIYIILPGYSHHTHVVRPAQTPVEGLEAEPGVAVQHTLKSRYLIWTKSIAGRRCEERLISNSVRVKAKLRNTKVL